MLVVIPWLLVLGAFHLLTVVRERKMLNDHVAKDAQIQCEACETNVSRHIIFRILNGVDTLSMPLLF